MMKAMVRVLIIVAVTMLVVGATVAVAQQTGALASDGGDRPQFDGGQTDFAPPQFDQASDGVPDGFGEREGENSAGGWAELVKNLGMVGVLTVGAVLVTKGLEGAAKVIGKVGRKETRNS
jgi:hypothetical protein